MAQATWATDEHVHLMVQCMEAWFFADTDSLAEYFGRDFNRNTLPRRRKLKKLRRTKFSGSCEVLRNNVQKVSVRGRRDGLCGFH